MELKKAIYGEKPDLVDFEGKKVRVNFDAEKKYVTDENTQDGETATERTVWEAYAVRVAQPVSRDAIVNAIVTAAYPSDRMQAIINNHFMNLATTADGNELDEDEQAHEAEYDEMQTWRKHAKEVAKEALEAYLEKIQERG